MFDGLESVRKDVSECGRKVVLVAACKTQTKQTVDEFMVYAPEFVLGENRVQELTSKYDSRYDWHFIGRLQTNKVKYIIDKVSLIHSLDRHELACEIEKQAAKRNKVQQCLVEVNMGAEITKGGVSPEKVCDFIDSLENYPHIEVKGIMSVMPNLPDAEELHGEYARLESLFERVRNIKTRNSDIEYLSAGMSGDYKIALAHGANMLRLGRLLFGERPMSEYRRTQK